MDGTERALNASFHPRLFVAGIIPSVEYGYTYLYIIPCIVAPVGYSVLRADANRKKSGDGAVKGPF